MAAEADEIGFVAPHVGAWIETTPVKSCRSSRLVAPHVGAWIETQSTHLTVSLFVSHPMWVRGLKLVRYKNYGIVSLSHPMWVRGLKRSISCSYILTVGVAPHVGAWIETYEC